MLLDALNFKAAIQLILDKLAGWGRTMISMLPNVIISVVVLVAFYFMGQLMKKYSIKIFNRFTDKPVISNLFATVLNLLVLGVGLIISLNILQLEQTVTSMLAGAGIVGLAIGFAFQDISANFISGIMMAFRKPIKVGDIIETYGHRGIVEYIDLRVTRLRTFQGLHVIIPNSDVFQNVLTNYTRTFERRIDLDIGISYGEDLEKVKTVTLSAIENLSVVKNDRPHDLYFKEFDDSSINFTLMFWINYRDELAFWKARSDVIMAVKKAYNENDITIPFPIRTLDFGIKGGKTITEMPVKTMELKTTTNGKEQ
ncbi:MAG TPA: mechanosensitive ion channel protein MscS [Cytophagales bacterium]|jgi:small conductance mechanosensitive channel|nr:mechanosensitive ion channel protein MscS [Cytophagales bacterium]